MKKDKQEFIDLEEIFKDIFEKYDCHIDYDKAGLMCIKSAMRESCKQVLKKVIDEHKFELTRVDPDKYHTNDKHIIIVGDDGFFDYMYKLDEQSIFNIMKKLD